MISVHLPFENPDTAVVSGYLRRWAAATAHMNAGPAICCIKTFTVGADGADATQLLAFCTLAKQLNFGVHLQVMAYHDSRPITDLASYNAAGAALTTWIAANQAIIPYVDTISIGNRNSTAWTYVDETAYWALVSSAKTSLAAFGAYYYEDDRGAVTLLNDVLPELTSRGIAVDGLAFHGYGYTGFDHTHYRLIKRRAVTTGYNLPILHTEMNWTFGGSGIYAELFDDIEHVAESGFFCRRMIYAANTAGIVAVPFTLQSFFEPVSLTSPTGDSDSFLALIGNIVEDGSTPRAEFTERLAATANLTYDD